MRSKRRSHSSGTLPQERPIFGKVLRFDDFQSFDYGILDIVWIDHGFLGNPFLASFLQLISRMVFIVSRFLPYRCP